MDMPLQFNMDKMGRPMPPGGNGGMRDDMGHQGHDVSTSSDISGNAMMSSPMMGMMGSPMVGNMGPMGNGQMGNNNMGGPMGNGPMGGPMGNAQMGGPMGNAQMGGPMGNAQMGGPMGNVQMGGPMGNAQMGGPMGNAQMGGPMGNAQMGNPAMTDQMGNPAMGGPMGFSGPMNMMGPDPNMMMMGYNQFTGYMGTVGPGMGCPQIPPEFMRKEIINLKFATLFPPAPGAAPRSRRDKPPGCRTIFVGSLPDGVSEENIYEIFDRFGNIQSVRLNKNNYCHIRYEFEDSVEMALLLSGYTLKMNEEGEGTRSKHIHVDYAQARDDQYEWECLQRALARENRHRIQVEEDRLRPPSPPPVSRFSEYEAQMLLEKLKNDDTFMLASSTLLGWLQKGDCNRRTANVFYSLIQSTNAHVRRLLTEKENHEQELEKMKDNFKQQIQGILRQFEHIENVFSEAQKQRTSDHFSKAQRKNIDGWSKQIQEVKRVEQDKFLSDRHEDEMEMSDTDQDDEDGPPSKRKKMDQASQHELYQLRDENDSLKCQLEAYKNEVDVQKQDFQKDLAEKDKQIKVLQQALQGMQQQLIALRLKSQKDRKMAKAKKSQKSSEKVTEKSTVETSEKDPKEASEKETDKTSGKETDKTSGKETDKTSGKETSKTSEKEGEKTSEKETSKTSEKEGEKTSEKDSENALGESTEGKDEGKATEDKSKKDDNAKESEDEEDVEEIDDSDSDDVVEVIQDVPVSNDPIALQALLFATQRQLENKEKEKAQPVIAVPSSSTTTLALSEKETKIVGLVSCFLHVHPFGASTDYLWSYLQRLNLFCRPSEIEDLMDRLPMLYKIEMFGVGASIERRWKFIGFDGFK